MSPGDFDLSTPELTTDDILIVDDPDFNRETVAIVTDVSLLDEGRS